MLTDPPFVGLLLVCFFVVVNFPQEEVIGGKFLLLIEGAPGLNSLGTENSTTAKPQLYPDPQSHYCSRPMSPSHGVQATNSERCVKGNHLV